jgi:putative hydrolase of the HAD superfamily
VTAAFFLSDCMLIKNIVFDIGNVLVKWDPASVVARVFPEENHHELTQAIFKSQLWFDLNLGRLTVEDAITQYHEKLGFDQKMFHLLMEETKKSLLPIDQSFQLLESLYAANYNLFALTDNVREIVVYLQKTYDFWTKFKGIVVSAEVGFLKPAPEIYHNLLNTFQLIPEETIFIDDLAKNVQGAINLGMHGIQFQNTAQCISELKKLNLHW